MWIVRDEQFRALRDSARERFCERLSGILRQAHPEAAASFAPDGLRAFVREGVVRGQALGFQSDRALGDYVSLRLQLGSAFDAHPAVRAVLEDPRIPAEDRIEALFDRLSPDDWRAARG